MMKPQGFEVAVVGNVGIDTNVYVPGGDIDFTVESNFTENLDYVGQAGGYSSRGYAQLGRKTAFIGYVGDDYQGRFIRQEFARDGIDTTALFVDPAGTSRSVNFMYRDGRRKNFYDGKGHMDLQPDLDLCRRVLAGSRLAHFSLPNWARHLLPIARELGLIIACDIQDVITIDDAYRQDFVEQADILFFSAVNQADPAPLIEAFLALNPAQIVISGMGARGCAMGARGCAMGARGCAMGARGCAMGARGCALGTGEGVEYFPAVEMEAPVVDTNGAGDGLAVGFLTSYVLEGYSLHDSITRGQIAARHTCTQRASSSGLITAGQLEHYSRTL